MMAKRVEAPAPADASLHYNRTSPAPRAASFEVRSPVVSGKCFHIKYTLVEQSELVSHGTAFHLLSQSRVFEFPLFLICRGVAS